VAFCRSEKKRQWEEENEDQACVVELGREEEEREQESERGETYSLSGFRGSFPSSLASSTDGVSDDED